MAAKQTNLLIQALSPGIRDVLLSSLEEVVLPIRMSVHGQEEVPRYAYFPTSGIVSVVVGLAEGGTAETALIGREGLTGALSLLGSSLPPTACFVQVEGSGYRMPLSELRRLFLSSEELRTQIHACIQQQGMTTSQVVACNKLHDAEARLARWLLMVQDRTESDRFQLTQEFLAEMLGTRRTTVALVSGALQRAGLIEYSRGRVNILDREGLKGISCECYAVTERLLHDLERSRMPETQGNHVQ